MKVKKKLNTFIGCFSSHLIRFHLRDLIEVSGGQAVSPIIDTVTEIPGGSLAD